MAHLSRFIGYELLLEKVLRSLASCEELSEDIGPETVQLPGSRHKVGGWVGPWMVPIETIDVNLRIQS